MSSSIFCPIESREALEAAAAGMVAHLGMSREDAFTHLHQCMGIICERVEDASAEALADELYRHGLKPLLKDDGAVLRPPRAVRCIGLQVRPNVVRIFYDEHFEDLPRGSLLLLSCGRVVVRRPGTAPRKQASDVRTLFHAGAGVRGATPDADKSDSFQQGAVVEQRVHHFLDLYAAPGGDLRHLRADRDRIHYSTSLDEPSGDLVVDFQRLIERLERHLGPILAISDRTFHGVPDFERHNRFLLNYPWQSGR